MEQVIASDSTNVAQQAILKLGTLRRVDPNTKKVSENKNENGSFNFGVQLKPVPKKGETIDGMIDREKTTRESSQVDFSSSLRKDNTNASPNSSVFIQSSKGPIELKISDKPFSEVNNEK